MPRILGIDIPPNKQLVISLQYIYGIGNSLAKQIVEKLHLDPIKKAKDLTAEEISQLNAILSSEYVVEGDLRRQVQNNIKRLIAIHSYRGQRHRSGLPVRGQRTRSNARTRKGKKKTVANKKI
jgi:small subunit ribosomal protein S13